MKWIIPVVLAALLAWFAWFQANSVKVAYVNGLAPYDKMPGTTYILQHDSYVFVWRKDPTGGFPLLGVNHPDVTTRLPQLPASEGTAWKPGQQNEHVRVVDRIAKGTRLLITSVRREESRREGIVITYEAKLLDDIDRAYQKVDLRPMLLPTAHPGDVPQVDTTILVPWIKK